MHPGISEFLQCRQTEATKEGAGPPGLHLPPYAHAYLQIAGDAAVKGPGMLDQDKLTAWIHQHEFHTIVGDIRLGPDGDRTEAKALTEQSCGGRRRHCWNRRTSAPDG